MEHPPDSTLLDYCKDAVSEEVLFKIEEHLNDCDVCAGRIPQMVRETIRLDHR